MSEELLKAGHEVWVYDSLVKGHREAVPSGARLVVADLSEGATLTDTLGENGIEAVVHMAAHSLVGESVTQPAKYFQNNVATGLVLLEAMRTAGARLLVFSSTAAVFGEPEKQPIEEGDPTRPTNPYGESKLAFERTLPWYDQAYGLKYASLRYFNAAGASELCGEKHDPETHLIPIILQVAQGKRESVTVYGDDYPTPDGTCVRDYIHVVDLARAHVLALEALAAGKPSRIYNLGCGGDGYSVQQVIDVARKVTGRPIKVVKGPRRAGDPAVLVASSRRIREELGWAPRFGSLEDIVASAWRFLERNPAG